MVKEQLLTFSMVTNTDPTAQSQVITSKGNIVVIFLPSYLKQTVWVCVSTWIALNMFLLFLMFSNLLRLFPSTEIVFMNIHVCREEYTSIWEECILGCRTRIPCNPSHRILQVGKILLSIPERTVCSPLLVDTFDWSSINSKDTSQL